MLQTQYKILAFGTICTNGRGWDQSYTIFPKPSEKVSSKINDDKINGILMER